MKKKSYIIGNDSPISTPSNDLVPRSENGARGFSLVEMTSDYDFSDDEGTEDKQDKSEDQDLISLLVGLGDELDKSGNESLANFADVLIKKFAQVINLDSEYLFIQLILKIKSADIPNTNDIIKKVTRIYSKSILNNYHKNKDLDSAKKSAYKKVLHRANQYISEV